MAGFLSIPLPKFQKTILHYSMIFPEKQNIFNNEAYVTKISSNIEINFVSLVTQLMLKNIHENTYYGHQRVLYIEKHFYLKTNI